MGVGTAFLALSLCLGYAQVYEDNDEGSMYVLFLAISGCIWIAVGTYKILRKDIVEADASPTWRGHTYQMIQTKAEVFEPPPNVEKSRKALLGLDCGS